MKTRTFALLLTGIIVVGSIFPLNAKASSLSANLSVGDKFTVDSITYRVSSTSGTLNAEPTSIPKSKTSINIPGTVMYQGSVFQVTNIPNGAFYGNYKAKTIIIGEGIKTIGSLSFKGADAVEEISLPSTLESFTTMGFKSLKTITLAQGNQHFSLKNGVLFTKDGTKLWLYPSGSMGMSYSVPTGTTTIGEGAFFNNKNLKTLAFANSVKTLEAYSLYEMQSLTSITLNKNISSIGNYNLYNCPNLQSITLNNGGTLGNYCIYNCASLKTITIDGLLSGYGSYSFYNLPKLNNYNVISSPYYASNGDTLFKGTELLRYPSGKTEKTYVVPDNIKTIAGLAFNYMQNTTEIILPPGVNLKVMAFHYPNQNAPISVYFRDKGSVQLSTSGSGVFVGLKSSSHIYLPTSTALKSFNSYTKAINPSGSATTEVKTIPSTSIALNVSKKELKKNESYSLNATLNPYYTTDDVTWRSSNPSVATVSDDGVITAKSSGKCTITATADSGVKASCNITVTKAVALENTTEKDAPSKETEKDATTNESTKDKADKSESGNRDQSASQDASSNEVSDDFIEETVTEMEEGNVDKSSKENKNNTSLSKVPSKSTGIGIAIGVICVVILVASITYAFIYRKNKMKNNASQQ